MIIEHFVASFLFGISYALFRFRFFLLRDTMLARYTLVMCPSVRPSVRHTPVLYHKKLSYRRETSATLCIS